MKLDLQLQGWLSKDTHGLLYQRSTILLARFTKKILLFSLISTSTTSTRIYQRVKFRQYPIQLVLSECPSITSSNPVSLTMLLQLILVAPAANVIYEPFFSFLVFKRWKGKIRFIMHFNRLNHLMILDMYREEIGKVDIRKIANQVIARRGSRKEQFGLLQIF